jgi:hypothetical protein
MKEEEKYVLYIDVVRSTYHLQAKKEVRVEVEGENKKIYFSTEAAAHVFLRNHYGEEVLGLKPSINKESGPNLFSRDIVFKAKGGFPEEGEGASRREEIHSIYLEKNEEK